MIVHITRDSVCAAEDTDPHANSRTVTVSSDIAVELLIKRVCEVADLPKISGGNATWCVSSNIPLAIVAQQWLAPRLIPWTPPQLTDLDIRDKHVWFHVSYLAREAPDVVYGLLRRLKLRSE